MVSKWLFTWMVEMMGFGLARTTRSVFRGSNSPPDCYSLPLPFESIFRCFRVISNSGGDDGIRTHDPLLAGQVLSQLSYTPIILWFVVFSFFQSRGTVFRSLLCVGIELSSHTVSRKVFSPLQSLTSVFGMGTGGPSAFVTPTSQ